MQGIDFQLNGMLQAALEALETGLARKAAPTQALTRAVSSLRAKIDALAAAPSYQTVLFSVLCTPGVKAGHALYPLHTLKHCQDFPQLSLLARALVAQVNLQSELLLNEPISLLR